MDLYDLKNENLEPIDIISFDSEKEIQSLIEKNVDSLFDLLFISTEFSVGNFRLDSLCFDNESNSFVIIEYKKGKSYSVIDQGYSYMSIMLNNKSDFILEYIEKTGKKIKKNEVDWSQSRIIFISSSFNSYQKNSVNFKDIPFELWEIKKFKNQIISLNQYKSSSKESIKKIRTGKNTDINRVNKEVKVFSEEDTLNNVNVIPDIKELYYTIKEHIMSWDYTFINPKKRYISFKKNKNVICYLNFRKKFIRVHISIQWKDSKNPKPPFKMDDPKKMFRIWENDYKQMYSYDLEGKKDLDYFLLMVKQKYDFI